MKQEPPWNIVGTKVGRSVQAALNEQFGWKVEQAPVYYNHAGRWHLHDKLVTLVRTDQQRSINTVPANWRLHSHFDIFQDFVEHLKKIGGARAKVEAIGSFDNDRLLWMLAATGEGFDEEEIARMDDCLLLTVPYIYGHSPDVRYVGVERSSGATWVIPLDIVLRKNFSIENVVSLALNRARSQSQDVAQCARRLISQECSMEEMRTYAAEVFKGISTQVSRSANAAIDVFAKRSTHTWWDAFMSVAFAMDHMVGYGDDTRVISSWYGVNYTRKTKAAKIALKNVDRKIRKG